MAKRFRLISIFFALAAAALVSGCGGGDSSLTKAEFIEQADVICRKEEVKKSAAMETFILKLGVSPNKPMTYAQTEQEVKQAIIPPVRSMVRRIEGLGAPDGDEAAVEAILVGIEKAATEQEEEAEKRTRTGKESTFRDPFRPAAQKSRDYGFKTCFVNY